MNIRHLEGYDDIRARSRINALAWREAYQGLLPEEVLDGMDEDPSEEQVEATYEQLREDSDGILIAEDDDGTVRGYLYLRWGEETKSFVNEGEADLKEIYVSPDSWGQGIGTELLERGLTLLPEDIHRVKLEMLSGNEVGRSFCESRGFERIETSEFEIAGDSYPTDIYTLER